MEPKARQIHVLWCAALVENAEDAANPSNVLWGDAVSAPTCVQRPQSPVLEGLDHEELVSSVTCHLSTGSGDREGKVRLGGKDG